MYILKKDGITIESSATKFEPIGEINHWDNSYVRVPDLDRECTQTWSGSGDGGTFESDWSNIKEFKSYRTHMSATDVKVLFTIQERLAIRTAREYTGTDPDELNKKYVLDDLFSIFENSSYVDANHQAYKDAIQYLADEGFITAERAIVIAKGVEIN